MFATFYYCISINQNLVVSYSNYYIAALLFSKQRFEVGGCMDRYMLSDRIDTSASVAALDENMNFMHVGNV